MKENSGEKFHNDELQILREKYDAKNNGDVREFRKKLILEKNPNIIKELGDKQWIEHLYGTPMEGELELYRESLMEKLKETENTSIDPNPEFDPSTGAFSSGFFSTEDKESALKSITNKITELDKLINID